jgi:hypothetical protein
MKKYLPYIVAVVAVVGLFLQWQSMKKKECSCNESATPTKIS